MKIGDTKTKRGSLEPGSATVSHVMRELLSKLTGKTPEQIKAQFNYQKKKLSDIDDVVEYIKNYLQ